MTGMAKEKHTQYFPLFVNLTGRRVTVVGGGAAAAGRAARLADFGANVRIIAPRLSLEAQRVVRQKKASWLRACFSPALLEGSDLAVAADCRAVNRAVAEAAKSMSLLCSVEDSRGESSFIFPHTLGRGPVIAGFASSDGDSAAVRHFVQWVANLYFDKNNK